MGGKRVSSLKPNPRNPRVVTEAKLSQLKKSLLEFGDLSGIVFNVQTGQLVGGHQRAKQFDSAAEVVIEKTYKTPTRTGTTAYGFVMMDGEKFSYREVSWDKHREMAANLAANKGAGEFDNEIVGEWMKELGSFDVDFDLELTMFDSEELAEFGQGITVHEHTRTSPTGVDEDEIPERPAATTKPGDLFQLGEHRLLCGDSTSKSDVERLMSGEKVEMLFTDPPYGIGYEYNHHDDSDSDANARLVETVFSLHHCGKVWTPGLMNLGRDLSRFGKTKVLVWYKKFAQAGNGIGGASTWEPILVFNPSEKLLNNDVLVVPTEREEVNGTNLRDLHSCPKPVYLFEQLISSLSKKESFVLDPFGGSGTTLIACEKTNRKCRMMEIDPHYCDVIVARWEQYTGKKAKLISSATKIKKSVTHSELSAK